MRSPVIILRASITSALAVAVPSMRRHSLIYAGLWLCKLPPLVWAHPRPSSSAGLGGVGAASAPALDLRPERLAVLRPAFAHTRTTTGGPMTLWHEATAQEDDSRRGGSSETESIAHALSRWLAGEVCDLALKYIPAHTYFSVGRIDRVLSLSPSPQRIDEYFPSSVLHV
jgi:hypothetical protein